MQANSLRAETATLLLQLAYSYTSLPRTFQAQNGNWDCSCAHSSAIRREAEIRKDLNMSGGWAGAVLTIYIPKKEGYRSSFVEAQQV